MTRRILITGGAGVIGQRLVEQHVSRGDDVRVIDRLPMPANMASSVDYVQGDLVHLGSAVVADFDPHVLYHLAAAFERSDENPEFWRENAHDNVAGSAVVLAGAMASGALERYVFASSYLIYDPDLYLSAEPRDVPAQLCEDGPINPRNACGAAKLLHEKEVELAAHDAAVHFTTVSARIYRVYGRSSRDIVSRWVRAAIAGEQISVYGEESVFDYVLADDVAEGLIRLADSSASGVVNLASGQSRSVRDLVACLRSHFPDLRVDGPHPASIYEASQASLERLQEFTGWTPTSSLEFGVSQLVAHELANLQNHTVSHRVLAPRRVNVLISSLSRKSSLVGAVRDSLSALTAVGTVWGADSSPSPPAARCVDRFWQMPRLADLDDAVIIEFCSVNSIALLIPTRDGELERFANLRARLQSVGTFVPIGPPASISLADDKLAFSEHLTASAIPSIPTALNVDDLTADRFVVKDRTGAGAKSMLIDIDRSQAIGAMSARPGLIAQPFIDGVEYSVDIYVRVDGSVAGATARRRVQVESGESVVTTTVDDPGLTDLARRCVASIGARGHCVVQLIAPASSEPLLLECNARVGGASPASFVAGLRSIDAMMLESLGEYPPDMTSKAGVTMTRLASDMFHWQ